MYQRLILGLCCGILVAACGGGSGGTTVAQVDPIAPRPGNSVDRALSLSFISDESFAPPSSLQIQAVVTRDGRPVAGVPVRWSLEEVNRRVESATLTPTRSTSDSAGIVIAELSVGSTFFDGIPAVVVAEIDSQRFVFTPLSEPLPLPAVNGFFYGDAQVNCLAGETVILDNSPIAPGLSAEFRPFDIGLPVTINPSVARLLSVNIEEAENKSERRYGVFFEIECLFPGETFFRIPVPSSTANAIVDITVR